MATAVEATWWRTAALPRCRAAYRTGGVWKARDALRADVAELLAQLLLQAQHSGVELLSSRVLLVLSALNPQVAEAPHAQLLEALLRDSLRSALRAEPVDLQSVHAIVTLALPGCPASAAKLTRALDALLLRSGAAAAPAAVARREENDTAAAAAGSLSLLPLPPLHVGPCRAASPPLRSPTSAAQQRACASRRVAADEALPVWSRAPPAACAADVTLIARFHADAAAVAALPPGAAAAVVAALLCEAEAGDDITDDVTDDVTDAGPVCGIMLSPLLDARGRLLRGTCALVHADAAGGPPRAHLYRSDALQTWLARPAPPTHPATRAPVARQHVFWLR